MASECSECWSLCCKAAGACRAEHLGRIRHRLMLQNSGEPAPCSDVYIAVADDARYWDKEVRRLAMLYLARGKRGGEQASVI